jgi:hypothetical protein
MGKQRHKQVRQPSTKEHQILQEAGSTKMRFFSRVFKGLQPYQYLDFQFLASRTMRE